MSTQAGARGRHELRSTVLSLNARISTTICLFFSGSDLKEKAGVRDLAPIRWIGCAVSDVRARKTEFGLRALSARETGIVPRHGCPQVVLHGMLGLPMSPCVGLNRAMLGSNCTRSVHACAKRGPHAIDIALTLVELGAPPVPR